MDGWAEKKKSPPPTDLLLASDASVDALAVRDTPHQRRRVVGDNVLGGWESQTQRQRRRLLTTLGLTDAAQDFTILFGISFGVTTPTVGTRGPVR